jgi:hypothetical protein
MKRIFSRSRRHRNPQQQTESQSVIDASAKSLFFANGAVQTKQEPPFFQPKLRIGSANDAYEKEADAVADKVVSRGMTPSVQAQKIGSIQRLATPSEEKMPATNDARMAEDKQIQEKLDIQRAADEEEEPVQMKEEEEPLQAKADEEEPVQMKEEEEPLQAKANSASGGIASHSVKAKIQQTKGGGQPLPQKAKRYMESAFGRDFGGVRIHTDSTAIEMNQELKAQAFTHGKDIYFNAGKFQPENTEGRHLLAHELTHVVQQNTIQEKGMRRKPKPVKKNLRETPNQ